MIEIVLKPKKAHLASRLFGVTAFNIFACVAILKLMNEGKYIGVGFCFFFMALLSWEIFTGLFFRPISGRLTRSKVSFQYLNKVIVVDHREISGYSDTTLQTRIFDYRGILFYLKDGRRLELSTYNIKDIQPLCSYLKEQKEITYLGSEKSHIESIPFKYKYNA